MQSFTINAPNLISIGRMLLAIVCLALLFQPDENLKIAAFIISVVIVPLDALDGYLARKNKQTTKDGAFLDIICDRLVESFFWVTFASLNLVLFWVPIIIISRGLITDSIRFAALKRGYEPFKMMQSKFTTWLVASRFNRGAYAAIKAIIFPWLILELIIAVPTWYTITGNCLVIVTVLYCVIRGLPVIYDAKFLFKKNKI